MTAVWVAVAVGGSAAHAQEHSLTTTFAGDNENQGIAFDLDVLPSAGVRIEGFDSNFWTSDSQSVSVYTRPGTHVGALDSADNWTLRGTVDLGATVENQPEAVPISFTLPAGTHGVAFVATVFVKYTNGEELGNEAAQDSNLRIREGTGFAGFGGLEITPRIWNGTIYYSVNQGPPAPPATVNCQAATAPATNGTEGDDNLVGTVNADAIFGLGGNDELDGVDGDDCLDGGDGDDRASGGADNDVVKGGDGRDKVRGLGGKDRLKGQGGVDRLNGGEGKDRLSGGDGGDKLRGGAAKDTYRGNAGDDDLNAVDAKTDRVNCGGGDDKAVVDPADEVSRNCETVREVEKD